MAWRIDEERFVVREQDGEFVILHLKSGDYFTVENVGARILRELREGKSLEFIEVGLRKTYPGQRPEILRRDLLKFVSELRRKKILCKVS